METHAEENYLKAIYALSENSEKAVLTTTLAQYISSKPSSVTDMLKRLAAKELVSYRKYRGVTLTEKGKYKALEIIRKHRLWELFLVSHLHFSWDEVHEVAEQLEHVKSPLLIDRLDAFLNYPARDPHGDLIPDRNGKLRKDPSVPLAGLKPGESGNVSAVKDSSPEFLNYLDRMKIGLGSTLTVTEKFDYDQSMKIRINRDNQTIISAKASRNILVSSNEKP